MRETDREIKEERERQRERERERERKEIGKERKSIANEHIARLCAESEREKINLSSLP